VVEELAFAHGPLCPTAPPAVPPEAQTHPATPDSSQSVSTRE
jgi:hypothetical protein